MGISALSVEYRDAVHKTFAIIKKANSDVKTVLGGVYPSISPEVAKEDENVDFIVISESQIDDSSFGLSPFTVMKFLEIN